MPRDLSEFFAQYATSSGNETNRPKQLVAVKDRILYAWTKDGLRVAVGLKYFKNETRKCEFEIEVKIVLTKQPSGNVEWIELNRSGSCLAVLCDRRLYVVFLPRALWHLRSLNEIELNYLCRTIIVDGDLTKKNKGLKCLRTRWHPGSSTDRHLVTLWTDDVIRIYNVAQPAELPSQIEVKRSVDNDLNSSKTLLMRSSLGESAVSFDFGSPVDVGNDSAMEIWPIFILYGNGDVYSVISNTKENKHFAPLGPLVMSPATDNNYGTDSCDLVFLPGKLPMLVIATTYGVLYHALVVRDEKSNGLENFTFDLFVHESVELEFSLATLDLASADVKEDNGTSNIILIKDPLVSRRYYVCHRAGLHSVQFSWADELEGDPDSLGDAASTVEYALCTVPKRGADSLGGCPIGLASISSLSVESVVVVLLKDFSIYCLPTSYDALSPATASEKPKPTAPASSRDYFIDAIKRLLQRNANVPVLRASGDKQINEQEAAELMCRCVEVLQKEYIDRLLAARDASIKRTSELRGLFAQQTEDVRRLHQSLERLKERNANSGLLLGDSEERQRDVHKRLEKVSDAIAGGETGQISMQEEKMHKELGEMLDSVGFLSKEIAQVTTRIDPLGAGAASGVPTSRRASVDEAIVKKRLEEQQQQIESLMRTMKAIENGSN